MLLRALRNLSSGIRRGEMFTESRMKPSTTELLMKRGVIAQASAPPLHTITQLVGVLDVLESAGVATLEDLIVAKAVKGLTAKELTGWQSVAASVMNVGKPCSNCRGRK